MRAPPLRPVRDIALVEPLEVVLQPLVGCTDERAQRRAGEVAVLLVDRLDAGSVDRQQLAAVEVEPPAQQHELAEHRFEGAAVVASEVRDRLEVGLQAAHQPDDLDIALGFPLQPSARSDPVEVAIDVELQQIAGRIARPPRKDGVVRKGSKQGGAVAAGGRLKECFDRLGKSGERHGITSFVVGDAKLSIPREGALDVQFG